MDQRIFVSLTEQDTPLAETLRQALYTLLDRRISVHFSTSTELGRGPSHGEDWFDWIIAQVKECDFAFILVTPASVNKPWILWEAGAVQGAAVAAGAEGLRKVRPLVYQLEMEQVPSPIRESKVQCRRGDREKDVTSLLKEVLAKYRGLLDDEQYYNASTALAGIVTRYVSEVDALLLRAPSTPTSVALDEWLQRLAALISDKRQSEVAALEDWMEIAFGRGPNDRARPLDLRLHSRLADVYLRNKEWDRAIKQLELARALAPRDMYVLRTLGKAYLDKSQAAQDGGGSGDAGGRAAAWQIIERMQQLDEQAIARNVECAALVARYYRAERRFAEAAETVGAALQRNPESHYLANLLGEVYLDRDDLDSARVAFQRARDILAALRDTNVWTHATAANAAFVLGDDDDARTHLRAIRATKPDAGTLATIERGLHTLARKLPNGAARGHRLALDLHAEPATPAPAASGMWTIGHVQAAASQVPSEQGQ
jgi:tetratricopeptide (TPR) repeat protein